MNMHKNEYAEVQFGWGPHRRVEGAQRRGVTAKSWSDSEVDWNKR